MTDQAAIRTAREATTEVTRLLRRWAVFVGLGLVLYAGLYLLAERQVRATGHANRFHMIASAPPQRVDVVVLGASHAMPFSYGDMEASLEAASGASITNLSMEGAGVLPNAFVLDYFLRRHKASSVLYVADSFTFRSAQWNEERLADEDLFRRAPLDPALVATFADFRWSWKYLPPYLSGFAKINSLFRFGPDMAEAEARFEKTYRPIPYLDAQRIDYLLQSPDAVSATDRYLAALRDLVASARQRGMSFTIIKVPTPPRLRDRLPDEAAFTARIAAVAQETGAIFRNYEALLPEDGYYFDTDHLNRTGMEAFAAGGLVALLSTLGPSP